MFTIRPFALVIVLSAACLLVAPVVAAAQSVITTQASPPTDDKPSAGDPRKQMPGLASPKDADPKSMPIPDKPSERQKLLENLYAYLATASSKDEAEPLVATIERLWLLRGTDTAFYLMERARKAMLERDNGLAIRFLDQVVELAPDYSEGWLRRAYVHMLADDKERALGDLRRCLALEPSHFQALKATGMLFLDAGQHAAALKAFEKLMDVHPNDPEVPKLIDDLKLKVEGQKT